MRRDPDIIVLAFVASTVVALLVYPSVAGTVTKPAFQVGDSWEYSFTLTRLGVTFEGSLNQTIVSEGSEVVGSSTYSAWTSTLEGNGSFVGSLAALGLGNATGTFAIAGEEAYEKTGLKAVRTHTRIEAVGTADLLGSPVAISLYINNTTTQETVQDSWVYPWNVGSTGTLIQDRVCQESAVVLLAGDAQIMEAPCSYRVTTDFEATEVKNLTVPAGSFSVMSVTSSASDGYATADDFAIEAKGTASRTVYDPQGQPVMELELLSFSISGDSTSDHLGGSAIDPFIWIGALVALTVVVPVTAALVARRRSR